MTFDTTRPASKDKMVNLRLTIEQDLALAKLATKLKQTKSKVLRLALDFWLENGQSHDKRKTK